MIQDINLMNSKEEIKDIPKEYFEEVNTVRLQIDKIIADFNENKPVLLCYDMMFKILKGKQE